MSNTTADKLALAAANKTAIKAAIVAKNPATAPTDVMSQWPTAIASIPSGGGEGGWEKPADWPDIKAIYNADTDTTYSNKVIYLVDTSLRTTYTLDGGYSWGYQQYRPARVRFSNGDVVNNPAYNYSFTLDPADGRYQWLICENNETRMNPLGPTYYPYNFVGLLWIYGSSAKIIGFRGNGMRSLQAFEVDWYGNDFYGDGSVQIDIRGLFKVNTLAVGYIKDGVPTGTFSLYNCVLKTFHVGNFITNTASDPLQNTGGIGFLCKKIYDGEIDMSRVTNFGGRFAGMALLESTSNIITNVISSASSMFSGCRSMTSVPATLNLSSCTSCSGMFDSCFSLTSVPATLDLSSCTNCGSMFASCFSLTSVPATLDLSSCTNCGSMFANCYSLRTVPDVLDLSICTNTSSMFGSCTSLTALPTHITCHQSLSFSDCGNVSRNSVATFDENGVVNGGMVYNLNTCSNSGKTISFSSATKALFTTDEWTAIKAALTAKNWGCSPA